MAAKDYINPNGFEIPTVPIAPDAYANVKPFTLPGQVTRNDEFYADEKIWQHEFCGTECDGSDHV